MRLPAILGLLPFLLSVAVAQRGQGGMYLDVLLLMSKFIPQQSC